MTEAGGKKILHRAGWVVMGGMVLAAQSMLGQGSAASTNVGANAEVKVLAFDVISVKQDKSDSRMIRVMMKPDGYAATNVSLKMLIEGAYGIREDLISGAPGWADSIRFDVDAKVAGADVDDLKKLNPEQRMSLLKPLLADRFKMKVHTETKQPPVYQLMIAKGGPKLKEATPGDTY